VLAQGFFSKSKLGTIAFMPPEVLNRKEHDHKMDVWALGIILCTMLTGHIPFVSPRSVEQTVENICFQELDFRSKCWDGVPMLARHLMTQMLAKDAKQRLNIDQVLKHPWISPGEETSQQDAHLGNNI
jgi:serine/threonine protein kinase